MTTKLVLRLFDAAGRYLGWGQVEAETRGDGCLWAPGPIPLTPEAEGDAVLCSIHWVDVNIEIRVPLPSIAITFMMPTRLEWTGPVLSLGAPPVSLHPVTVRRSTSVEIPAGWQLASAGSVTPR